MTDSNYNLLNYNKWNRRILNLYWICNIVILLVEIAICIVYFTLGPSPTQNPDVILPYRYILDYIITPSGLILFFTALCEMTIRLMGEKYSNLKPYVITFTCTMFCVVLIAIHYSVNVIYVTCTIPFILSLVYNKKRVLSVTFLFSVFILAGAFIYMNLTKTMYFHFDFAEISTSLAILLIAYLICLTILSRLNEIIDISVEANRSAYELKIAKSRAEAEAEARSRFLAHMSHEIRTPMSGIIGLAELAVDNDVTAKKRLEYLQQIRESSDGLLAIINDILDISKIDAGEFSLKIAPFYLHEVLSECEAVIMPSAANKGLTLSIKNTTDVSYALMGDSNRLRQALLNFLSNSVKFTENGLITLNVSSTYKTDQEVMIHFEIRDTGIGLTKEQCEIVFEPFKQADDRSTRHFDGTGLGLPITKSIVEMMGGEIIVKSVPNIGSKFSFSILFKVADKSIVPAKSSRRSPRSIFSGEVLVCEDNAVSRQVVVEGLKKLGLTVTAIENGKLCLEELRRRMFEKKPFDIILMDINMPVIDGLQAAKKIIEMNVTTPIIAITANAMVEDRKRCMEVGITDYISKPFKLDDLCACLEKYILSVGTREMTTPIATTVNRKVIDIALGIENSAESESLYREMLQEFYEKKHLVYHQLERAIAEKDYESARRIAHSEKGVAGIIGALGLVRTLANLEKAFAQDMFHPELLELYQNELNAALDTIGELIK